LDDIRRRYHVMNTAAHRALDEHWRTELDGSGTDGDAGHTVEPVASIGHTRGAPPLDTLS
jgi:hypothetical protein